jgi:hypothetical protein
MIFGLIVLEAVRGGCIAVAQGTPVPSQVDILNGPLGGFKLRF